MSPASYRTAPPRVDLLDYTDHTGAIQIGVGCARTIGASPPICDVRSVAFGNRAHLTAVLTPADCVRSGAVMLIRRAPRPKGA